MKYYSPFQHYTEQTNIKHDRQTMISHLYVGRSRIHANIVDVYVITYDILWIRVKPFCVEDHQIM